MLNPQAGGPPLVSCSQLLMQYIHSQLPSKTGGRLLHPKPEDGHAVVTRDPPNMAPWYTVLLKSIHLVTKFIVIYKCKGLSQLPHESTLNHILNHSNHLHSHSIFLGDPF
jgi:hypothetical protein